MAINDVVNTDGSLNIKRLGEYHDEIADVDAQLAETVTLKPSGINDTINWNNAISSLSMGGQLNLTSGDYFVDAGNLKSNMIIHGRGYPRILSDTSIFPINSGSSDITNNIKNITFEYLVFEAITKSFSEHIHLLKLSGVSNITFRHCIIKGFRGDGVYLGSGDAGQERHNENINFIKCTFDGVANQNRNGLSIIDGNGVYLERCHFKNCTMPTMPGAIDIEPNANAWSIIKNIHVRKCKFNNIGGNVGVISLILPLAQSQLTAPVENITIEGCSCDGAINTQGGLSFKQNQIAPLDDNSYGLNIKVINNKFKNLSARGFGLQGIKGAMFSKNDFVNYKSSCIVGFTGVNDKCSNIRLRDNLFKQGGTVDGNGLSVFTVDRLDIIRNTFDDCGKSDGMFGNAINYNNGVSSNVRFVGNDVITPTGRTKNATFKEVSHTFTPATNTDQNNTFNGLPNLFVASLVNPLDLYTNKVVFDATILPDSFVLGVSTSIVNSATSMPTGFSQGVLVTHKLNSTSSFRAFTTQWYYPRNNSGVTLTDNYYRRANSATNDWSAWHKITGVAVATN